MELYNQKKKSFIKTTNELPRFSMLANYAPEDIKKHDEEIARLELEQQMAVRDSAFKGCGVNEDALQCSFKNYHTPLEDQKKALSSVWDFTKAISKGEFRILVLIGCPGSGKTHLATACLNVVMHSVKKVWDSHCKEFFSGRYVLSRNIASQLMETYSYSSKTTYDGVINSFCLDDFLVIDEIGRDPLSQQGESSGLFAIIDKRKSKRKPLAMVSNYSWKEFQSLLGSAAMSRILQSAIVVDMSSIPDYRMEHKL